MKLSRLFIGTVAACAALWAGAQDEPKEAAYTMRQVTAAQQTVFTPAGEPVLGHTLAQESLAKPRRAPGRAVSLPATLYAGEIDHSTAGARTLQALVTITSSGNQATVMGLWGLPDTLQATISGNQISIQPAQIYNHSTYGPLWACPFNAEKRQYSTTDPITGTIADDGSITLDSWGVFVVSGASAGGSFGTFSSSELKPSNATMTDVLYDGQQTATGTDYSYPIYIDQTLANQVSIINFTGNGAVVNMLVNSDQTVEVIPQRIFTNPTYGEFFCYAINWAVSTYNKSNITGRGTDTEVTWGQWGVFSRNTPGLWARGMLKTTITMQKGAITYPPAPTLTWSGTGSENDPFLITTRQEWLDFAQSVNLGNTYAGQHVALGADVALSDLQVAYRPVGSAAHPFNGTFDGRGHSLTDLTMSTGDESAVGLFGFADSLSYIGNLNVERLIITSYGENLGGLVGISRGSLSDITVTPARLTSYNTGAGGIVGTFDGTRMERVTFNGTLQGQGETGGLIGSMRRGVLSLSRSAGSISITTVINTTYRGLGGLVGGCLSRDEAEIEDCINTATITDRQGLAFTGGLVGDLYRTQLRRSLNLGAVSSVAVTPTSVGMGTQYEGAVGGVAGRSYGGTVNNCMNANLILNGGLSSHVGGIVGHVATPIRTLNNAGEVIKVTYGSRIESSINAGEVILPLMYATQGLYGNSYADSVWVNCYFDQQLTGNIMPDANAASICTTARLTAGEALPGLDPAVWQFTAGRYPLIASLAGQPEAMLATAPAMLAQGETSRKVKTDFAVNSDNDIEWQLYDSDKQQFVTETGGLSIDGDTLRIKHINSSEMLVAHVKGDNATYKMLMLETVDPTAFKGSGTEDDPYLIQDKEDLMKLNQGITENAQNYVGDFFKQTNDIDLAWADDFVGIGPNNNSRQTFSGSYDGQGYSIHRLHVNGIVMDETGKAVQKGSLQYGGFFGYIGTEGTVKNLNIAADCIIEGWTSMGAVAGRVYGKVQNCRNYAPVTTISSYAAGIAGSVEAGGAVENCYNAGAVTTCYSNAGGIVGNNAGSIVACQNDGVIRADSVMNYYSAGTQNYASGISAYNRAGGSITDCVNTGSVFAYTYAAGICGYSTITTATSGAVTTSTVARCLNYGIVDYVKTRDRYRGAISARELADECVVENNYFDSQLGYYDAANTAPCRGTTGLLTRQMTGGDALPGLDEALMDYKAGSYPILKAFADEPAAQTHRRMVLTLADENDIDDVTATATTADSVAWTLVKAQQFSLNDKALAVTLTGMEAIRDTLIATANGYTKRIPLRAMPLAFEGEGTAQDPFQIKDKDDMLLLARLTNDENFAFTGRYFKVMNDIDFGDTPYRPIALDANKLNADFDGNGMKLLNINYTGSTVSTDQDYYRGVFGSVGPKGRVHHLTLQSGTIAAYGRVGGIVGRVYGTVDHCDNYATVRQLSDLGVGGIAAMVMWGGKVADCQSHATLTNAKTYTGGVVFDLMDGGLVENCESYATFTNKSAYMGGVVARSLGTVTGCANHTDLTSTSYLGGIVGHSLGGDTITRCVNYGNISSTATNVGGIVGAYDAKPAGPAYLGQCVNHGVISTTNQYAGGIVGRNYAGLTIEDCVNNGDVDGNKYVGGITGYLQGSVALPTLMARCLNKGFVSSTTMYAGGISGSQYGYDETCVTTDCQNYGGVVAGTMYGSGITGSHYGVLRRCVNAGKVESGTYTSGISGYSHGLISQCVNVGDITMLDASNANATPGGLTAISMAPVEDSYNMGTVTGPAWAGGVASQPRNGHEMRRCYNAGEVHGAEGKMGNISVNVNGTWVLDSVYYDNEVNPDVQSTVDQQCQGLATRAMLNAELGGAFTLHEAMYPTLTALDTVALLNWAAALPILNGDDTPQHVMNPITIGTPEGTVWTSSNNLAISGNSVVSIALGDAWLTKTFIDLTGAEWSKTYNFVVTKISSVEDLNAKPAVTGVTYYNVAGMQSSTPFAGVNLVVTRYADGTTTTAKLVVDK